MWRHRLFIRVMSACCPRLMEIYQISVQGENIHFHLCLPATMGEQDKSKDKKRNTQYLPRQRGLVHKKEADHVDLDSAWNRCVLSLR